MRKKILGEISAINILMLLFVFFVGPFLTYQKAEAASLGALMMRLDRMSVSATLGGTVCAKATTVASTEGKVVVNFPTGFAPGAADSFTINTAPNASWPTTGTTAVWIGINSTATTVSGTAVTIVSGNLDSGTPWYCFNFTSAGTNSASSGNDKVGSVITQTAAGAEIDSAFYATSLVATNEDTITVTAVVPPTFTFLLSGTADTFTTNLSTTTSVTSGKTLTIMTNAANGWTAWVQSANAALNSTATGGTIATAGTIDGSPTDLSGTTGYVLDVDTGTGTPTIAGEYDGTNATSGGTLATSFQQIASGDAPTATDTVTLIERAKIVASQIAANDYTDTLTVIAAGLY